METKQISTFRNAWRKLFAFLESARSDNDLSEERVAVLARLEEQIDYVFKDKQILNQALSHRSYAHDNGKGTLGSYERLEFLGDAVLGMIVSDELFRTHPEFMEGELTRLKSSLVSGSSLARCSTLIDLHKYLLFTGGKSIMEGKSKATIQADSLEALLGAMYIDGSLEDVRRFVTRLLLEAKDSISEDQVLHSTKSNLLQLSQERFQTQPSYKVVKTTGPEHDKVFTCEVKVAGKWIARGSGTSKKEAEKVAALHALKILTSEDEER